MEIKIALKSEWYKYEFDCKKLLDKYARNDNTLQ